MHPDNGRHVTQLGDGAGLVEEAIASPDEIGRHFGRPRQHGRAFVADGDAGRKILLDRNVAPKMSVVTAISDAEAAEAQHGFDAISPDHHAGHQGGVVFGAIDCSLRSRRVVGHCCRASLWYVDFDLETGPPGLSTAGYGKRILQRVARKWQV